MTLSADVQARVPTSRLIQLTNLTSAPTSSITSSVLDAAIADAKAEFKAYIGVDYDEANAQHTPVGVVGTLYWLTFNKGMREEAEQYRVKWYELMDRYAKTAGLRWFSPGSNVPYTPSTEQTGIKPDMDRSRFRDVVPRPPTSFTLDRRENT